MCFLLCTYCGLLNYFETCVLMPLPVPFQRVAVMMHHWAITLQAVTDNSCDITKTYVHNITCRCLTYIIFSCTDMLFLTQFAF